MSSNITVHTQSLLARLIQITFFCQLPGTIASAVAMALAVQFPSQTYCQSIRLSIESRSPTLNGRAFYQTCLPSPSRASWRPFRSSTY